MLKGVVTQANGGFRVGMPVRILAQTQGDTTAIAIAMGDLVFAGAGLVVIAIIAILIALLLPAVQKGFTGSPAADRDPAGAKSPRPTRS